MKSVLQFIKMLWMALYMGVTMGIIIPITFSIALPYGLLNLIIDKDGLSFAST